jgi:hypothetical protein
MEPPEFARAVKAASAMGGISRIISLVRIVTSLAFGLWGSNGATEFNLGQPFPVTGAFRA